MNKTHDEICFFKSKTVYSKLAQLHRIDGPAIIGKYGRKIFYINNESLNQDQWKKHPEVLKKAKRKNSFNKGIIFGTRKQ